MAKLSLRTPLTYLLLGVFWAFFCLGYFSRFPLPGFLSKVFLLSLTFLLLLASAGYGYRIVRWTLPSNITDLEALLFSVGSGLGLICLLMMAAGVAGLWTRPGALVILTGGLLLAWPSQRKGKWIHLRSWASAPWIPSFLLAVAILVGWGIVFAPVTYYDSLVYHLRLPQLYVQAKHWVGFPELIYSAFPQNMEMLWTWCLLLAGDPLANGLGWGMALVGVAAVYAYGKRFFSMEVAHWSAALLLTMPSYLLLSSGGYVDVGLAVFIFLSYYAISLWVSDSCDKSLWMAGGLAGMAMGVKYTAAIPFAIGGLMILWQCRSQGLRKMLRAEAIFLAMGLAAFSPWLVKNAHFVGNPVFPFLHEWKTAKLDPWTGQAAAGYFRGLTEYAPRSGGSLFKLLWDIATQGLDFGGGMDVLGDLGWAPLFVFLPAIALVPRWKGWTRLLLAYCAFYFMAWGTTRPVLRFLLPVAPMLALLSAEAYATIQKDRPPIIRWAAGGILCLLLFSSVFQFYEVADTLSLWRVPFGVQSRSEYLAQKLNYFQAASFVNTLPENSLTYVIGDQRGYYYNKPAIVTPVFNENPLTRWANQSDGPKALAALLRQKGITHLLINHTEFDRLDQTYHLFPFTDRGRSNWILLQSRIGRILYRDASCEVLAL
jgi:4-amino-4-deoxy-L-arabinose transferase-like glycosyltransferase